MLFLNDSKGSLGWGGRRYNKKKADKHCSKHMKNAAHIPQTSYKMTTVSEERAKLLNEREACAMASTCWAVS